MNAHIRHAIFLVLEKLIRWSLHPKLRAKILKILGADIGRNVRVCEVQFINLKKGFKNLHIADNAYLGAGALIDLEGELFVGERSTISPRAVILTHQNPGGRHGNRLARIYPGVIGRTVIGKDCWIGASATILCGVCLGDGVLVGSGSVVNRDVEAKSLVAGVPARMVKKIAI